ncbi:hypothetical protein DFS34DRAFT_590068 [Phlyctochytrium arcticum]|nr:hypothetical protein DFS34DRAFT_590068 [Phlyctochytrium arcticum]
MTFSFEQETSFVVHSARKVPLISDYVQMRIPASSQGDPEVRRPPTSGVGRRKNISSAPREAELVPTSFWGLHPQVLSGDAERQMIPYAVHPARGCSPGVMPFLLPPSRSRLRAENFLGDAERQMIPYAVHPPRGCDEGKSSKLLRGSDATPPPAEAEQASCRKSAG